MFYTLITNASGAGIGMHAYVEQPETLPSGEVVCTEAQAQNPTGWAISGGTLMAVAAQAVLIVAGKAALAASDISMTRITEAVARGQTSFTTADVVAFATWRGTVRAIVDGTDTTSTALPAKPPYPAHT